MERADVPLALHERLGAEATAGLLELFDTARQEWTADVTTAAVERFERRLSEESANWRVALARTEAALRLEMHDGFASLRQEMRGGDASVREEIRGVEASLRQQIREVDASLRQDMRDGFARAKEESLAGRFELLRWCFMFWVGQVFAVAGALALVLRFMQT